VFLETGIVLNKLSKNAIFDSWSESNDTDVKKYIKFYNKYKIYIEDRINIEMYETLFRKWLNFCSK